MRMRDILQRDILWRDRECHHLDRGECIIYKGTSDELLKEISEAPEIGGFGHPKEEEDSVLKTM